MNIEEYDAVAQIDARQRKGNRLSGLAGSSSGEPDAIYGDAGLRGIGAGKQKNITRTDYRFLSDAGAMRKVERLAEALAVKLKRRISRRHIYRSTGTRLDLRRTIRKNLANGGLPINRVFAVKKTEPIQLVILHDISHSMAWNNPLLFRFARGLIRTFKNSYAFAFHTRLFPVTHYYRAQSLQQMRQKLEANNRLWMGGTRIAESLSTFNKLYARNALTTKTVVVIISDGFDTDNQEHLEKQLTELSFNCKKIVWLNPVLGREGVTTTATELEQQFPQIARFIPANNLAGLQRSISDLASALH